MDPMEIDDSEHMRKNFTMDGLVTKFDPKGRKPSSRCASVCLGLMCTLLFAANVGQFLYYYMFIKPMSEDLIQTAHSTGEQLEAALTKDKEQLQKSYNTLKQENDQLQTNYYHLQKEKDEIERNYSSVQSDKDQLKQSHTNLTQSEKSLQDRYHSLWTGKEALQERNEQLQTNYSRLETVKDQLEKNFNKVRGDLTREKDQLQQSYNTVKQEKDQLQTNYNNAQRNLNNLQREKNDIQTQFNTLRTNRDELQRSNAALKSEKNQLQSQFNSLQREKDQLRTDYNSLTQVRDQLQLKVTALDKRCPGGWNKFGLCSCFYVSGYKFTWNSCLSLCIRIEGHLAILNSNDKMTFVNGLLKPGVEAWIGLTDSVTEGTWKWVDGSGARTTFWGSGQPNSYGGDQDCVEFTQHLSGGHWNDEDCSNKRKCICEKSL